MSHSGLWFHFKFWCYMLIAIGGDLSASLIFVIEVENVYAFFQLSKNKIRWISKLKKSNWVKKLQLWRNWKKIKQVTSKPKKNKTNTVEKRKNVRQQLKIEE